VTFFFNIKRFKINQLTSYSVTFFKVVKQVTELDTNTVKTAFFAGTGTLGPNASVRLSPFDISQISDHF
jgi:hypothetical protein